MEQLQSLGSRLLYARKQRGMTLDIASEKSGMSRTQINLVERDMSEPTYKTVISIAKGLDISVLWLMMGIGDMDAQTDQCPRQYKSLQKQLKDREEELKQVKSELKITHQMIDKYGFGGHGIGTPGKTKVTEVSPKEVAA